MAKRKKQQQSDNHLLTGIIFVLLGVILVFMIGYYITLGDGAYRGRVGRKIKTQQYTINLGPLTYQQASDGRAEKRDDQLTKEVEKFLINQAEQDLTHKTTKTAHYRVLAVNEAEDQLLLAYGINGDETASMFAVKKNDGWQTVSPTNKFDSVHRIAACDHVKEYQIDKQLAPVCYTDEGNGQLTYSVR